MSEILWYVFAVSIVGGIVALLFWCVNKFFDDFMGR